MNAVAILTVVQQIIKRLPESTKKEIDAEIDKIEDKFKEGGFLDKGTELACKILRGSLEIKDYPDLK